MSNNLHPVKLPETVPLMKKKSGEVVRAIRWNPPDENGVPKQWMDWTDQESLDSLVTVATYNDLSSLLGTSGCSATRPYWTWSVIGLIFMDNGKLTVNPGDWIIEDSVGCIAVYTAEQAGQLLEVPQ